MPAITSLAGLERLTARAGGLRMRVVPASAWPEVRGKWEAVEMQCPTSSIFVHADWMETWLDTFSELVNPAICLFEVGGRPVGCCLLVEAERRVGPILTRQLFLNSSGESEEHSVFLEYNELLAVPGFERMVAQQLAGYVRGLKWEYLQLDGAVRSEAMQTLQAELGGYRQEGRRRDCYYVDLEEIRTQGGVYEQVLSHHSRSLMRRSVRRYESTYGKIRVEEAATVEEGWRMLADLADRHQATWQSRGQAGAFHSAKCVQFHMNLIERLIPQGKAQLLRISAGPRVIGLVYSLVYRGQVRCYQGGFTREEHHRLKPGMTSHYYAVQHNLKKGMSEYDFMAGDYRSKESMTNAKRPLDWVTVERGNAKTVVIRGLRAMKRRWQAPDVKPEVAVPDEAEFDA